MGELIQYKMDGIMLVLSVTITTVCIYQVCVVILKQSIEHVNALTIDSFDGYAC